MGGMLAAESTLGEGSVFTVTLPVEAVIGTDGPFVRRPHRA